MEVNKCIESCRTAVECLTCGMRKNPRGRSAPLEMANSLCDWECPGYNEHPRPGHLWPNEELGEIDEGEPT